MSQQKYKCSTCEEEFDGEFFDKEQMKCFLHCDKNEQNNWFKIQDNKKIWNQEKIRYFWEVIQKQLDNIFQHNICPGATEVDSINYKNVIFPKHEKNHGLNSHNQDYNNLATNFYSYCYGIAPEQDIPNGVDETLITTIENLYITFEQCTFLDKINFKRYNLKKGIFFDACIFEDNLVFNKKNNMKITLKYCNLKNSDFNFSATIFNKKFEILNCKNINNINFNHSTFNDKVKIQYTDINGKTNFYNTKFNELADFYQTKFNKEVSFERTDFNKISVFSEANFAKDVDFKYTKFIGKSIFRDTVIGGELNLRDTIFDDAATFLDITSKKDEKKNIKVKNRETARVIKDFYDKANNIIEANRFYALEMKQREKEIEFFKNPMEFLIFKFHGLSSNHSQDWLLVLLWIINIVFLYIFLEFMYPVESKIAIFSKILNIDILVITIYASIFVAIWFVSYNIKKLILIFLAIISSFYLDMDRSVEAINRLIKWQEVDSIYTFCFKIIIAYLVYQLIVSVRQNTRRK